MRCATLSAGRSPGEDPGCGYTCTRWPRRIETEHDWLIWIVGAISNHQLAAHNKVAVARRLNEGRRQNSENGRGTVRHAGGVRDRDGVAPRIVGLDAEDCEPGIHGPGYRDPVSGPLVSKRFGA